MNGRRDDAVTSKWRLDVGEAPDPRFSFANERTFLAWCRTALALMTAGLAIAQLLPAFDDLPGGRRLIGLPLIAGGIVLSVGSFFQWLRNERAMRLGHELPRSLLLPAVAFVIAVSAAIALVAVVDEQ